MKPELADKLKNRFSFINCYMDILDGWFDLIWKLCEDIEKLELPEDFTIDCIKQKYASLRIYSFPFVREVIDLVDDAEARSASICEDCGNKGKIRGEYWIYIACDKCEIQRKEGKK
jgi:hypothetical protein